MVAWDGTPESQGALDWAVLREAPGGGTVVIVRIVNDALLEAVESDAAEDLAAVAQRELAEQAENVAIDAPAVHVGTEIMRGDPIEQLLQFTNPATLLVLGTHDPASSQPRFAWSLGARLITDSRSPLVIIPAGLSRNLAGRGVVVGVDGSPESVAATAFAGSEAERMRCQLTVVHTWREPVIDDAFGRNPAEPSEAWLEPSHHLILDEAVAAVQAAQPSLVIVPLLQQGRASHVLEERGRTAALLVLGSRGYGPVRGPLMGSVSTAILGSMPCPVVVTGPSYTADRVPVLT
ncbi:hypothetical protein AX769_21515 (plasmid) [Frondihabitans sp. PAMC 28766]|nr:hypothetical protein AX769_21515 [Frondihabitans sp. PAMC 28766]